MEDIVNENSILLVDGFHGIYVPQHFAKNYKDVFSVYAEDILVLEQGPEHPEYWEVWESVLNNAVLIGDDKQEYSLYQDGDLWALPVK